MSGPHFEQLRTRLKGLGLGRVGMKKLKNLHKGRVVRKFRIRECVVRKFRTSFKCYEQLMYVDNMNIFKSWAQGFRCNEKLKAVVDMNDFRSWPQHSRFYAQLKAMDYMNDLGFHELRPLDGMDNSRVWLIWTIHGCETMSLKYYEQHKLIIDMNDSSSWVQGSRCYEQLRVVDDMNDFGSGA